MSVHNNRQSRLQIPEEAIEGPAGMEDVFTINGFQELSACQKKEEKPNKKNTKTIIPLSNQRQGEYDIGLEEGMVIPVKNGGIAITMQENRAEDIDR